MLAVYALAYAGHVNLIGDVRAQERNADVLLLLLLLLLLITNSMDYGTRRINTVSKGLSNNHYPEPNQLNSSY